MANLLTLPQIYLSNDLFLEIIKAKHDPSKFVHEAVKEKLGKAK